MSISADDVRMCFELALPQTLFHRMFDVQCLFLTATVDYNIIRIAFERAARKRLDHPHVEYMVQEDVGQ